MTHKRKYQLLGVGFVVLVVLGLLWRVGSPSRSNAPRQESTTKTTEEVVPPLSAKDKAFAEQFTNVYIKQDIKALLENPAEIDTQKDQLYQLVSPEVIKKQHWDTYFDDLHKIVAEYNKDKTVSTSSTASLTSRRIQTMQVTPTKYGIRIQVAYTSSMPMPGVESNDEQRILTIKIKDQRVTSFQEDYVHMGDGAQSSE